MNGKLSLVALVSSATIVCTGEIISDKDAGGVTSTFEVRDGTLYIDTPAGASNTYNYASLIVGTGVTNVVKTGKGILVASASQGYKGDWHFKEGVYQFCGLYSFGSDGTATASNGRVFVEDGASLQVMKDGFNAGAAKYKDTYIRGSGTGLADAKGAVYGVRGTSRTLTNARLHLADDATLYSLDYCLKYGAGSIIDVAGHVFSLTADEKNWLNVQTLNACIVTNSSETGGMVDFASPSQKYSITTTEWHGGPENVLKAETATRVFLESKVVSEDCWTLRLGGGVTFCGNAQKGRSDSAYQWSGPVELTGDVTFGNDNGSASKYAGFDTTFTGPMSGSETATVTLEKGFCLKIGSTSNTFGGIWNLTGNAIAGSTYRCCIDLYKDAVLSGQKVLVSDSDLHMNDATVYAIPPVFHKAGDCTIDGGATGTEIAAVTKSGSGLLTLDTPAAIPVLNVEEGRVVSGTRSPKIGRLNVAPGAVVGEGLVYDQLCVKCTATLDEGTYPAFYTKGDVDLSEIYGSMAKGNYASFTKREVTEGEFAGYTLVEMEVTTTPVQATWSAVRSGGDWNVTENWGGAQPPAMGGAVVTFPKAQAVDVPVEADINAVLYGFAGSVPAFVAGDETAFGYAFDGSGTWYLGSEETVFTLGGGQNRFDVPLVGDGTLEIDTALYPYTNMTDAAYARTVFTDEALERVTGEVVVNASGAPLKGVTELGTAKFTGKVRLCGGQTYVNSLDFIKEAGDLSIENYGSLYYTGPDVTIPALTYSPAKYGFAIGVSNELSVQEFITTTAKDFYKFGPGTLKILGTNEMTFAVGTTGSELKGVGFAADCGYSQWPMTWRHGPFNVTAGTLEIGVKDDPDNAPVITVEPKNQYEIDAAILVGSSFETTASSVKLVVNNGRLATTGDLSMNFYTPSEDAAVEKVVEVNGGELAFKNVDNRIASYTRCRASHTYVVNGGKMSVAGDFNLTQLCPITKEKSTLQSTVARRFIMNGGEMCAKTFRMAFSFGRGGSYPQDDDKYGQGWQPDSHLTVNGGTMEISDYLLTCDRSDSRSWTALNGGTLKVGIVSNTVGKTASTYLSLNGGTLAPIGAGDNPGGLVLEDCFMSAVVSTNGAIVTTEFLPADQVYAVRQPLGHDPDCGVDPDGGLVKRGAGALELDAANTFTGPVSVEGGTLVLANRRAIPSRKTPLSIATGCKIDLATPCVKVSELVVNGVRQPEGTYGSTASSAATKDDTLFAGTGVLQVGSGGMLIQLR